jgi:hypothetical protein
MVTWKWIVHTFFVEAFGLCPFFRIDKNHDPIFDFVSKDGMGESVAKLQGLRDQMKLERSDGTKIR